MNIGIYKVTIRVTLMLLCLCTGIFLCSCGWFAGDISDQEVTDLHKDMRAQKRTTVFDYSLRSLGQLLKAYYIPKTAVQCKNIGNQTAAKNLPSDLYTMIASSLNKIGHQITFIPFDAQYVIAESTTGGTINRIYPNIVISGGITGFDKDMFEKEREVEAAGGWAGAQGGGHMKASGHYSRVTVDLNMLNYITQAYFPGVVASNSIALKKDSFGWGVYGYYMGNGASFDYDLKRKQGVHAALRTLTEFSVLQLLGKYFEVPYWRTIKGANPDTELIELVRENFMEKSEKEQNLIIKKFLFLHGFNGLDRNSPVFKGLEESSLKEAMRQKNASSLTELYMALWKSVPLKRAIKRVRIDRRKKRREALKKAEEEKTLALKRAAEEETRKKELQRKHTENVNKFNAHIRKGDNYYRKGKYSLAYNEYIAANRLFGGEQYPVKMIKTINGIRSRQKQAKENMLKYIAYADNLFKKAESDSFNYANYKKAMRAYSQALKYSPKNSYLQGQIAKIKKKLSKYNTVFQTESEDKW